MLVERRIKNRLIIESKMLASDSMKVLEEFEKFEESLPRGTDEELSKRTVV